MTVHSSRAAHRLSWRALAGVVLLGLTTANCTDTAGPEAPTVGQFSIVPMFESAAAGIVAMDQVGIVLKRSDSITVALDTMIALEPGQDSVDLTVTVIVLSQREQFFLEITITDLAGDTVFRGGPTVVTASTSGGTEEPVLIPLVYTGVGADAASVRITTVNASTFFGDSVQFVAVAMDTAGVAIDGTPVRWHTTDETIASFPDHRAPWAHGGSSRGSVPVVATLLNGPTDTSSVLVQPTPVEIKVTAGDGQTAPIGGTLPNPIEVEVTAADSLGVEGVLVVFEADDPNGAYSVDSVMTDPFGKAQSSWTLGLVPGALTSRAVVPAIADTAHVTATSTVTLVNWINAAGGNWSNPANWNPAIVPGSGNQAAIDLDGTYTVVLDVPTQLSMLNLGAPTGTQTLAINGSTLTLDGPSNVDVNGVLDLTGGLLDGLGNLWILGNMLWSGGTMNGAGTIVVAPGGLLNLGGGAKIMDGGRSIDNGGNVTWLSGDLTLDNGSQIMNQAAGTFGIQGDVQLVQGPGTPSAFFNLGQVSRSTGIGIAGINVVFDNNGGVDVLTGTLDLAAGGFGTGSFNISAGATLHFVGGNHDFGQVVNSGTIDVAAGIAKLTGTFTHNAGALLSGLGEFKVDGDVIVPGDIIMPSGELAVSGTLSPTGGFTVGTVTFFGPAQTIPVGLPYQNIQVFGTSTVTGSLTMSGFVVVFGFGDLTVGTSSDLTTPSDIIVSDDAKLRVTGGGVLNVGNDLRAQNNAVVSMEGGTINVANSFATLDAATLAMGVSDVLDVEGNVDFGGGSTSGMLTEGTIHVGGDFSQYGDPFAFDPTGGAHQTIFDGTAPQTISIIDFTSSGFQDVLGAGLADLVLATEVEAHGDVTISAPGSVLGGMQLNVRGDFSAGPGATLDFSQLELDGIHGATAVSVYNVGETKFNGPAQTIPMGPTYQDITVVGTATVGGSVSMSGILDVSLFGDLTVGTSTNLVTGSDVIVSNDAVLNVSGGGILNVGNDLVAQDNAAVYLGGGSSVTVANAFATQGLAILSMGTGDQLDVEGNVDFGGGSTSGMLMDGVLYVGGDFKQYGDPESFVASGVHTTIFDGTIPQNISFIDFVTSQFQNVTGAGLADLVQLTEVEIAGDFSLTSPGSIVGGMELNVRGNMDAGSGATLDLIELEIDGTLSVNAVAVYNVFETNFNGLGGQTIPIGLPYQRISVSGDAAFEPGSVALSDRLQIEPFGILGMNGADVTVGGDLEVQADAMLVMNTPGDNLAVMGNVTFGGGNSDGFLTEGTLYVGGDFHQMATSSPESFHAGLNHTVVFNGTVPQNITFDTPGIGIAVPLSHFANLAIENPAGVMLMSDVFGHSNLISGTGVSMLYGNGYQLKMGGLDVQDLVMDRVLFEWNGDPNFPSLGTWVQFTNVTFQNYAATDPQFTILHPGEPTSVTFSGLNFTVVPTAPGYYIRADDIDGGTPDVLSIIVTASSPATSGGRVVSAGGASIAW